MQNRFNRGMATLVGLVLAGTGLAAVSAAPAAAGSYDCPAGYFCGWTGKSANGSMWKTNKNVADLGSWDNKIRSYTNRTKKIACVYEDKNYVPWGGYWAQEPNEPGEYSGYPVATTSSIKFVRTERECSQTAYPRWFSQTSPKALGFGDMNGDRRADMVIRDKAGRLWFTPGNGTGKLIGSSGWNKMNALTRHGDFNGDGREDLIAREASTGKLWLYPGTSTGKLGKRKLVGSSGWNAMANLISVGDFSGDGRPDLATVTNKKYVIDGYSGHPGWLVSYRGRSNGTLTAGERTDGEWWGLNGFC
ncbi:ATP/GTP-binding protein [Streptomyces sp. NTH33]|uniref:peptidase inhibitor family I36 protein n=1 Tax=Streptomyces sp. NTH33 TaxID=1735453 RepID=UPI000DAAD099|nr:peptidase inhibitor family I36 protein [Streptomyces sp. NTH33]PZH14857.1 ATP/GTP-binding protein [Streptomyces sp. NTH33]